MKQNNSRVLDELLQMNKDWDAAMIKNDVEKIGSYMADNWIIVATEGGITSKSTFLEYIKPGVLLHDKMDFENLKVEVYGDTAVIVARGTSAGTYMKEPFSYYEWSTSIFHRSNRGWLCVLTMLTPAKAEG